MSKIIIKCNECDKKKRITKRHKAIIGNQCEDCLRKELEKDAEQQFFNDLYN